MRVKIRGKKRLQGIIEISGAKNSAVAIIPAAILCDEEVILRNIPNIHDVQTLINILEEIGYSVNFNQDELKIKKIHKVHYHIKTEEVKKLRGSYYFMGSFLGKLKKVKIYNCGGCNLGYRPINYHLDGFQKLGVKVKELDNQLFLKAHKLIGSDINLQFPSVGATINIMLASVKAKGLTTIKNAAIEPEVVDVGNFLIAMGAKIDGLGTSTITITGVNYLHKCIYSILSDRIEAGTYLILGAIASGKGITVKNIDPSYLIAVTDLLKSIGCNLEIYRNEITVKRDGPLIPCDVVTKPYPSFPTDLGQLITVLMTQIEGTSTLKETIFSNRFSHVEELKKMGADINVLEDTIYVNGITKLKSAPLTAYDLRGSASLVLAGTINRGITTIENIEVLLRGYEKPIEKLQSIGLTIELIDN